MLLVMMTSPSHAVCDDGTCLELQPGNNLVSFSSLPADASISSVFGGLASSIVLMRGEGVVAHRLSNGSHAGNLVTIERNRGYWVTLDAPSAKTLRSRAKAQILIFVSTSTAGVISSHSPVLWHCQ